MRSSFPPPPNQPSKLISSFRVVLVRPSLPENVGAVARSMKHFGLSDLVLVGGCDPMSDRAIALSAGATEILQAARQVDTLDQALEGCLIVIATTARALMGADMQALPARTAAALAAAHAAAGPVALLFGTEKHGLSKAELRRAHQIATIPGEPEACLNLAMAVTVLAYECYVASREAEFTPALALAREVGVEDLAEALITILGDRGLLKPRERESKGHSLKRVLSRMSLDVHEAAMLRGLLEAARRETAD